MVLTIAGYLVGIATMFTFLFFLRAVAQCLRARAVARSVQTVITLTVATVISALFMVGLSFAVVGVAAAEALQAPREGGAGVMGGAALFICGLACITMVLALVTFIWFIVALIQVRGVVGDHVERA
jgi:hypothetical protein